MNLQARLNSVERERSRLCSSCGGPIVAASPPRSAMSTFEAAVQAYQALSDGEKIEMARARGKVDLLPPRLRHMAAAMDRPEPPAPA